MRKLLIFVILFIAVGCKKKRPQHQPQPQPNFFRNLYTGEIISQKDLDSYVKKSILPKDKDSLKKIDFRLYIFNLEKSSDSIIANFKYNLRFEYKYLKRPYKYEKIGMKMEAQTLTSIDGEKVVIGGKQEKPMLINLWFIGCRGCESEMPDLNRLKEKYADKVNFVSLTFDRKENVLKFLKRKKFTFTHITDAADFINKIGSHPYPENIFIDRNGYITHIEGLIHKTDDVDLSIKYFEFILNKLIK